MKPSNVVLGTILGCLLLHFYSSRERQEEMLTSIKQVERQIKNSEKNFKSNESEENEKSNVSYKSEEESIIEEIVLEYKLDEWDQRFMIAIRVHESGPPGNEFGVEAAKDTDFRTQAKWAAGTIKKNWLRFLAAGGNRADRDGYVQFFGKRWCPLDPEWSNKVNSILKGVH